MFHIVCDAEDGRHAYEGAKARLTIARISTPVIGLSCCLTLRFTGAHSARLLSFTLSASTYTSPPSFRNFSDISAMPTCWSFKVAA